MQVTRDVLRNIMQYIWFVQLYCKLTIIIKSEGWKIFLSDFSLLSFHLVMIPSITQKVHRLGISAEPQRVSRISQIKLDGLKTYEKNQRLAILQLSMDSS